MTENIKKIIEFINSLPLTDEDFEFNDGRGHLDFCKLMDVSEIEFSEKLVKLLYFGAIKLTYKTKQLLEEENKNQVKNIYNKIWLDDLIGIETSCMYDMVLNRISLRYQSDDGEFVSEYSADIPINYLWDKELFDSVIKDLKLQLELKKQEEERFKIEQEKIWEQNRIINEKATLARLKEKYKDEM